MLEEALDLFGVRRRCAVEQYAANTEKFILEDNKISQMQQPGLRSRHAVPGRFHPTREPLLWKFQNWVARTAYGAGERRE